ncbi:hypothetical protein ACV35N_38325, partial [Pseudomonas aeruginosa]
GQLRQEAPEKQELIQITESRGVPGNQRQSNQQPIPITTPTLPCMKGKPPSKGASLAPVLVQFDSEGKSLKKPVYEAGTRTLTLNYPLAQYPALLDLLRNQTVYCQFLAYPNGHVWADLHTGAVRAR